MDLRDTSRSVDDILYSLGTSLQRFKGDKGLKRFLDAGRLSWLSFVGEFQETRDELFSRRTSSLNSTRKCLLTLNDLFEDVTRYATKLSDKVEEIARTLDQFHRCCDLELESPEEADNESHVVAQEKLTQMAKANAEIREALADFCSSASTCKTLNASTVSQLEEIDKETAGGVGKAQTDFDAQRRRVQLKEDEVNRLRDAGLGPHNAQVQLAEFNLQCEKEALQAVGDRYFVALQDAMTSTSFGLEQTCMATWASSNVFFVQYATFLHEFELRSRAIARLLVDVKNSQAVSKKIGVERKAMLDALRSRSVRPAQADAGGDGGHVLASPPNHLDDLFGPPAADQGSSLTPMQPTANAAHLYLDSAANREDAQRRQSTSAPAQWGSPPLASGTSGCAQWGEGAQSFPLPQAPLHTHVVGGSEHQWSQGPQWPTPAPSGNSQAVNASATGVVAQRPTGHEGYSQRQYADPLPQFNQQSGGATTGGVAEGHLSEPQVAPRMRQVSPPQAHLQQRTSNMNINDLFP